MDDDILDSPIHKVDYELFDENSFNDYINNIHNNNDNNNQRLIDDLKNENTVLKKLIYEYVTDIQKLNNKIHTLQKEYNKLHLHINKNKDMNNMVFRINRILLFLIIIISNNHYF